MKRTILEADPPPPPFPPSLVAAPIGSCLTCVHVCVSELVISLTHAHTGGDGGTEEDGGEAGERGAVGRIF